MKTRNLMQLCTLTAIAAILTGCAAVRTSITEQDPGDASTLTADFDQRDLLGMADDMAKAILENPFPPEDETKPIVVALGFRNNTKTHLDMRALSDSLTTKLLNSGKIRLASSAERDALLREQNYQVENATPETKAKIGRQLGAKYMLTGAMTEIRSKSGRQVRVSKREDVYYQLTVTVTDIETGLVVLRKQQDRLRRARKPLFGW